MCLKSLVFLDSGCSKTEVGKDYGEADKERGKEEKEAKGYHPELSI